MLATVCVGNTTFLGISNAFVVKVLPGVVWIVSRAPLIHDMGKVVSAAGLQRGSAHGSEEDPTFFTVGATTRPATGVLLTLVSTENVPSGGNRRIFYTVCCRRVDCTFLQ